MRDIPVNIPVSPQISTNVFFQLEKKDYRSTTQTGKIKTQLTENKDSCSLFLRLPSTDSMEKPL